MLKKSIDGALSSNRSAINIDCTAAVSALIKFASWRNHIVAAHFIFRKIRFLTKKKPKFFFFIILLFKKTEILCFAIVKKRSVFYYFFLYE